LAHDVGWISEPLTPRSSQAGRSTPRKHSTGIQATERHRSSPGISTRVDEIVFSIPKPPYILSPHSSIRPSRQQEKEMKSTPQPKRQQLPDTRNFSLVPTFPITDPKLLIHTQVQRFVNPWSLPLITGMRKPANERQRNSPSEPANTRERSDARVIAPRHARKGVTASCEDISLGARCFRAPPIIHAPREFVRKKATSRQEVSSNWPSPRIENG
jgi:hypothetical protein